MLIVCKKCNVEHDARDVNNGVCVWCEQKENNETQLIQATRFYFNLDRYTKTCYTKPKMRG